MLSSALAVYYVLSHAAVYVVGGSSPLAALATSHEGRGVSDIFVPATVEPLEFRVTTPASITETVKIPAVAESGVSLLAHQGGVFDGDKPVNVIIATSLPLDGAFVSLCACVRQCVCLCAGV